MLNLNNLLARRELDEWRDEQTLIAADVLNQSAADMIACLDGELKTATWKDGLIAQGAFLKEKVEPKVKAAVQRSRTGSLKMLTERWLKSSIIRRTGRGIMRQA
jgi:hypothetical protein